MDAKQIVSKKLFRTITILSVTIGVGVAAGGYYGIQFLFTKITINAGQEVLAKHMIFILQQLELIFKNYFNWVLPIILCSLLLAGWIFWLILRLSLGKSLSDFSSEKEQGQKKEKKKDFIDQKIEQDRKRRLYLHTLSVFQREGRLLDFFREDLNDYDDEQIGAAVRSIQEDCKKVVKKYVNPKPVIDQEEGDTVTVEQGFDMDSINLVGNVSGQPPFKGVLNHRGWKAGKREIPKLSDIQDSTIIIPAEIEVQ